MAGAGETRDSPALVLLVRAIAGKIARTMEESDEIFDDFVPLESIDPVAFSGGLVMLLTKPRDIGHGSSEFRGQYFTRDERPALRQYDVHRLQAL